MIGLPQLAESHSGAVVDQVAEFSIIQCTECGFRHVAPLPSETEIDQWYREHHYSDGTRDRIDYYERDRDWWLMAFRDVYAVMDSYLPPNRRRLIDVGSGTGIFLEVGQDLGWQVVGYEPNKIAANHCRSKGLEIIESSFPPTHLENVEQVDVVHMRNVLEHVVAPTVLIQSSISQLHPGGLLVVGVPNDYNPFQRAVRSVDGIRPWWLAPPHHLNYFDFESLELLLQRCGMEVVGRYTSFPIDLFLAMGENYVDKPDVGRSCHLRRVRFESTFERAGEADTRRALYRAFASVGLGRDAIVIARRPC